MWKEDILTHLGNSLNRQQSKYEAEVELVEVERNMETRTLSTRNATYKSKSTQARGQVYSAPICDTWELTKAAIQRGGLNGALSRTYLHIQFGQNAENAYKYESGDHIAVWLVNLY